LKRKNGECAACLKYSVRIFVEKICKMGILEGSGVPVLYIGRTVPKGPTLNEVIIKCTVYCIVHLQCTLSLSLSLFLS
jgi:hypothetical protein